MKPLEYFVGRYYIWELQNSLGGLDRTFILIIFKTFGAILRLIFWCFIDNFFLPITIFLTNLYFFCPIDHYFLPIELPCLPIQSHFFPIPPYFLPNSAEMYWKISFYHQISPDSLKSPIFLPESSRIISHNFFLTKLGKIK